MRHHLRIAALQCNFQTPEKTLAMPEKWANMGFDTEQLLHPYADLYSALYDEQKHGALVSEYLKRSKEAGLHTIMYMNCHILGPSIADKASEWGVRNADNSLNHLYGTYSQCCVNSGWKDYFFDGIRALGKYEIEGVFFDGPMYHTCHCPACRAKFRELNGRDWENASNAERDRFAYDSVIAFKDELYRLVKSVDPQWKMYFNEGIFSGRADADDLRRQLASDDLIGYEGGFFFYDPPKEAPLWYCAASAKLCEAVASGRPTVTFFAGDHKMWGWYMHTPAETELCYLSALGNGSSIWYGIHCNPENLDTETGKRAAQWVQFDKKYDAFYQHTESLAEIAVFFSFNTARYYAKSGQSSDLYEDAGRTGNFLGDYRAAYGGAFTMLDHLNLPWDIVTELNLTDLSRYRVVIAPDLAMVDENTRKALTEFVASGGTLIADGETGRWDGKGKLRETSAFADLFGAEFSERVLDFQIFNYFSLDPQIIRPDNAFDYIPAPSAGTVLKVFDGEVIGTAPEPLKGCYSARPGKPILPVAVKKEYGKGNAFLFSMLFFEFYQSFTHPVCREILRSLLDRAFMPRFALHGALPGVSITCRKSGENVLVHLTNYVSAVRPITRSAEQCGLTLTFPPEYRRVVRMDLEEEKELPVAEPGKVQLPALAETMVLRLER